jgi:transposase
LHYETKGALVELIAEVLEKHGVSIKYCCEKLSLDVKRYQRWVRRYRKTDRYGGGKPGPKKAPHRLLPEERRDIITLAKNDKYMDISHRQLSVVASETGELEASASSFYRLMKQEQLMEKRQRTPKTPQTKPEVKVDGPNQVRLMVLIRSGVGTSPTSPWGLYLSICLPSSMSTVVRLSAGISGLMPALNL